MKQPSDAIWKASSFHLSVPLAFSLMAIRWLPPGIQSVTRQEREVQRSKTPKGVSAKSSKRPQKSHLAASAYVSLPELYHMTTPRPIAGREPGRRALWLAVQSYRHPQTASLRIQSIETRVPTEGHLWSTSHTIMFALVLCRLLRDSGTFQVMTLATFLSCGEKWKQSSLDVPHLRKYIQYNNKVQSLQVIIKFLFGRDAPQTFSKYTLV